MSQQVAPSLGHGRYQIIELLGVGGMALVYKAFDTRLDVSRAVKVLKPELDDVARERFFNEARTMAKLHHKNVVMVHDVADDGQHAYLVMELIEGGSVADRMAAFGALPERMACAVAIAMLDGLGAAHQQGVVHRDVKPHNILVDATGTPKVTDFGIAQAANTNTTRTGAVIGTWAYMAPEQRSDAKAVDARADLYAVGCALYNMLTAVDPFDLYNKEVYEQIYADVPAVFHEIIQKATRYKADDRYQTAAEFKEVLEDLLLDLPEDPEGTPPLGVSLEGERAQFAPTMMDLPSGDISSPTLEVKSLDATPLPAESRFAAWAGWSVVPILGLLLLLAVGAGGVLAATMITGAVVIRGSGDGTPTAATMPAPKLTVPMPIPIPVVPLEPTAPPEIPAPTVRAQPTVELPVLEVDEWLKPERREAILAKEPAAPIPMGDEPRPVPVPAPVAKGNLGSVVVRVKPAGGLIKFRGEYYTDVFRGELENETEYKFEFSHTGYPTKVQQYTLRNTLRACWDLEDRSPCAAGN